MPANVRSISTKTADSVTNFTINRPSGMLPGDILIAIHTVDAGDLSDMGAPTGWALLAGRANQDVKTKIWWKLGGGEPSSYTFTQFVFARSVCAIVAVSGATGTPQVAQSGSDVLSGAVSTPSVTPSGVNDLELRWATGSTEGPQVWSAPATYTLRTQLQSGDFIGGALAAKQLSSSAATGSLTFSPTPGVGPRQGFTIALLSGDDPGEGPVQEPDGTPPSADIHWRYIFVDAATDAYKTDLDLDNVSLDRRINQPGTLSADVPMPNPVIVEKVAKVIPRYASDLSTGPGRTICHVLRNGVIWGSYLVWQTSVSSQGRSGLTAHIQGATLESYFNRVEIRTDLEFVSQDQLDIARTLISQAQAQTYANIGVTPQSGPSGVVRDRTYTAGENGTFGQRLKELAEVEGGFEFMIHTYYSGSTRLREWRYGYPTLGNPTASHVFRDVPTGGNVVSWSMQLDATQGATSYRARGESVSTDLSTTSTPLMSAEHNATALLAAGHLRLDRTVDYSSVKEIDTLEAYAEKWVTDRPGAARTWQVTVRLDRTTFTPANLGDHARLIIVNDWWPRANGVPTFDQRWRIIGISIKPTERSGQETANLIFEEVA